MRGAGGTQGGEVGFLIGLAMMIAGFYLLFNAIDVRSHFGFGVRLFGIGGMGITTGILMIPFLAGVGILFYSAKNLIGWLLAAGALIALIVGVLVNAQMSLRTMSAFDLMLILVLSFGGLGLFLRSLRQHPL